MVQLLGWWKLHHFNFSIKIDEKFINSILSHKLSMLEPKYD